VSNVESCPTFWQTLQLPFSGWICTIIWSVFVVLYRAGSGRALDVMKLIGGLEELTYTIGDKHVFKEKK
jgi:hypothetical protein